MTSNDKYTEFGVDNKLQPLSSGPSSQSTQNHYKCVIKPALSSGTAGINADEFYYQSFVPELISLLGREGTGANFKQIAIIIPSGTSDGTHQILPETDGQVTAALIADGLILHAKSGSVTFTTDAASRTIKGTASFKVQINRADYIVDSIQFDVAATGPL